MAIIICPNCKSELIQSERTFRCSNNHSFDQSKEGYVNLLLANQKSTANPGDNKLMINARDAFLSANYYDFLLQEIETQINSIPSFSFTSSKNGYLLDLGCGSGYYSQNLVKSYNLKRVGIDISKHAVAKASKKDKKGTYLVGSAFDLPIATDSVDITINVFSPIHLPETLRVLKQNGIIIKVIPGPNHMREVAELVYDIFKPHHSTIQEEFEAIANLKVIKTSEIERTAILKDDDLINFISMTPYLYKFSKSDLGKIKTLSTTLSFKIIIAQK